MDDYHVLLNKVQSIITNIGYNIYVNTDGTSFVFYIYHDGKPIASIEIGKSFGLIIIGKTRRKQEMQQHDIFIISWVTTEPAYRGQGLALLLIIYGICYLKQYFPFIHYVTLDDVSDRTQKISQNIYDSLGFVFQRNVQMDMSSINKLDTSGPEKQLLLDDEFIRIANYRIDSKFGRRGGKRKKHTNKKMKKKSSTKKQKK